MEALRHPGTVTELIVADDSVIRHVDLLDIASNAGIRIAVASPRAVAELVDTVTPQGVIAVCQMIDVSLEEALAGAPQLVVLCDQVRDPGNVGTVIRCADAFGADAVLISRDSVDVYNAKAVRATTGSLFHLPLAIGVDLANAASLARKAGLQVLGADADAPSTVDRGHFPNPHCGSWAMRHGDCQPSTRPCWTGWSLCRSTDVPKASTSPRLQQSCSTPPPLPSARSETLGILIAIARAIALTTPALLARTPTISASARSLVQTGAARFYRRSQSRRRGSLRPSFLDCPRRTVRHIHPRGELCPGQTPAMTPFRSRR